MYFYVFHVQLNIFYHYCRTGNNITQEVIFVEEKKNTEIVWNKIKVFIFFCLSTLKSPVCSYDFLVNIFHMHNE